LAFSAGAPAASSIPVSPENASIPAVFRDLAVFQSSGDTGARRQAADGRPANPVRSGRKQP